MVIVINSYSLLCLRKEPNILEFSLFYFNCNPLAAVSKAKK